MPHFQSQPFFFAKNPIKLMQLSYIWIYYFKSKRLMIISAPEIKLISNNSLLFCYETNLALNWEWFSPSNPL